MFKHASANRFYRLVWSTVNACWVAVAEGTRGRGKGARQRKAAAILGGLLAAGGALATAPPDVPANALPQGGQVVAGQASILSNGAAMTINQATAKAILDWQSFDIGSKASVNFNQPSSSAVALNRVTGTDPSRIYGQLSSNGQVFLINNAGVLFGAGAQVNVGGLVASSLGLSNQDFLNGNYDFAGNGSGAVRNAGSITANQGAVALLGPNVANAGTIAARNVALAAGERIGLDLRGDGLITVQVARGALAAAIDNKGVIRADGGQVVMTASAADALARSSVNNTGLVQARGFAADGGSIRLVGDTVHAGNLDVSSTGGKGGTVGVSGAMVSLDGKIDASGLQGGSVSVDASGAISAAASTLATGRNGQGGAIAYRAGTSLVANDSSTVDASGTSGGSIAMHADGSVLTSAKYGARASAGVGGRIDISGADVRLLGAQLDASGVSQGGLVRVGGAFQGGLQRPDAPDAWRYTGRWGNTPAIVSADSTFIGDNSVINVSASGAAGQGGTAVVWSDAQTTMLGSVKARGAAAGGVVEISSKDELRHVGLEKLDIGAGGRLLLDPKNITIGSNPFVWTYQAVLGKGFSGGKNLGQADLDAGDAFGFAVALDAAGRRMAVGAPYDDGYLNAAPDSERGAVRMFTFTDSNFSGASLKGTIGSGYTGTGNVDVNLPDYALFGSSVALSGDATRLAVGAPGEGAGSVRVFSFADSEFGGVPSTQFIDGLDHPTASFFGTSVALNTNGSRLAIGSIYDTNVSQNDGTVYLYNGTPGALTSHSALSSSTPEDYQLFGVSVSFDGAGDKLAVGATGTNGGKGAVYLYSDVFGTRTLGATIRDGGGSLSIPLYGNEAFGSAVALNAAGTRLAVGSSAGRAFNEPTGAPGNVRIIDFSNSNYGAPTVTAVIGRDYTTGANGDIDLADTDNFGTALAFDASGTRLVVGAPFSNSQNEADAGTGSVHAFQLLPPVIKNINFNDARPKPALDATVDAALLAAALANGISVTLQANNNISWTTGNDTTVTPTVTAGSLTLQAGNSVALNSSITTGNGNLTVVANEIAANGAISNRDAGNATITVGAGKTINTGTGTLSMTIADGAGRVSNTTSGDITISGTVTGNLVKLHNRGATAGSDVIIASGGTVTTPGGTVEIVAGSGGTFTNSGTLSGNRYLVYSNNPGATTEGVTGYSKHYNQTYTGTTPVYAASGSWFFYSVAPTLTLSANSATRVYDGTATPPALTFGSSGYIDGDTAAIFSGALAVANANKNVGTYAIQIGTLAQSLGYAVNFTGNNLTITQKSITAAATASNKIYNGTNAASVLVGSAGVVGADVVNFSGTGTFANKTVGNGKTVSVTGIALSGADAANYTLGGVTTASTTANITPRTLNVSVTGTDRQYDGTLAATAVLGDDRVAGDVLTVSPGAASFTDKNVGEDKIVNVSGIGVTGTDAGNYTYATTASGTADITKRTLNLNFSAGNKVYDGNTSAIVTIGSDAFGGDVVTLSGSSTFANKNVGAGKTVTTSGVTLGGADAGNYALGATSGTSTAAITARLLTFSTTANGKVYDGNTTATLGFGDDRVAGDVLALAGSGNFDTKNVGTGKTVNVTGIGASGTDAGNYTLAATTATTTAAITARSLTATATGNNKVYDATLAATATYGDDRVAGDVLSVGGTASFTNKNVGAGKAVNVTGMALTGTDAGNYTLASTTTATTATITPRSLTASATGNDKVYNGNLAASVTYGDNRIAGDILGVTGTASFANKNVGTGKAVTVTGMALAGADAGNYTLASSTASTSASITARTLTASATGNNKVYDATLAGTAILGDDRVAGDVLTLTGAAAFGDKNVGVAKALTVSGIGLSGLDSGNYTLASSTAATTASITPRALTATASGNNKVYDGVLAATATLGDNRIAGDVLAVSGNAAFGDKNVGAGKAVNVTGLALSGTDAANYTLVSTSAATTASITPRALAATAVGSNKVYDGNLLATATYGDDRVAGDTLAVTGHASFTDKNAGIGKTVNVTGIALSGLDAGNYTLASSTTTTTASITPRALTTTAAASNKVYDATVTASATFGDNRLAGDVLAVTGSAAFADKNAGAGKTVNVTGLALSGLDAANYTLASTSTTTTANITPRALTATAIANNKVYDATLAASATYGDNRLVGDQLSVTGNAAFGDKNVGTGKAVSITGMALAGADAGNYTLVSTTAAGSANITPRALNGIATGIDKVYDATTNATITLADDRVAGDVLTLASGSTSFANKNVGAGKTVTVNGLALSGADAANYTLASGSATTTASITPRTLVASATGANKVYDATVTASATLGDDRLAGDVLVLSGTAQFDNKNAGTGKTVSVSGISLAGADAGNYVLASNAGSTIADISARTLAASATGVNKTYDGTTAASVTYGDDRLAGDLLTVSGNAAFGDKNAGSGKAVGVTGMTLAGVDAGNYVLASTSATTSANIAQRVLATNATATGKTYDGTTAASASMTDDRVAGDLLTLAGNASFADKNAGTGKTVTVSGISLGGTDAGNYVLGATSATATADIAQRSLTASAAASDKVYDGSTTAAVTLSDDRIAGDILNLAAGSANFADKNAGNGKAVTASGISLGGADAGNYVLASTSTTSTASITPKALNANLAGTTSKVYDGSSAAAINGANVTLGGFVAGEGASVSNLAGSYNSANVNGATSVSAALGAANVAAAGGTALSNYALPTTVSGAGAITARSLTIGGVAAAVKVFDGTTVATLSNAGSLGGLVAGEALTLNAPTSVSFDNRSAGTGKLVTASGYSLSNGSGGLASNYLLASSSATTTGTINKANLTVTADNQTRIQGTANPALTFSANGLVASDSIALLNGTTTSTSATVDSPVGTYAINVSGNPLNDYQIVYVNGVLAVTTPPSLFDIDDAFGAIASGFDQLGEEGPDNGPYTLAMEALTKANKERAGAGAPVVAGEGEQVIVLRGGTEVVSKRRGVRAPSAPQ